jgi:hypothetical protein
VHLKLGKYSVKLIHFLKGVKIISRIGGLFCFLFVFFFKQAKLVNTFHGDFILRKNIF